MKDYSSLSASERCKFNTFQGIQYDVNLLLVASKQLTSNPDPDFICCLSSKLSTFIQDEVLPLVERHDVSMRTPLETSSFNSFKNPNSIDYENENTENTENCMENH